MYKPIDTYILRDLLWYKGKQAQWTDQLYEFSTKNTVELEPKKAESLINILNLMAQDEKEDIKRKALCALANLSSNSASFITKCVEMGVLKRFIYTFLDYTGPSRMAIFSMIGSYFRLCTSEDVVFQATQLHLLDFMMACLASTDESLMVAASRAVYDMILHVKMILDFSAKGLFELLALFLLDDLPGKKKSTLPLVALVRRASEHIQPVTQHIVESGCLGVVSLFVHHPSRMFQKMALCTIVNISIILMDYVIPLYGPDLFCDVISILMIDDVEMKFYAGYFIRRVTETSRRHTRMMLENGLLEALVYSLQTPHYKADPSLIALENVLEASVQLTKRFIDLKGHLILATILYKDCCEYTVFCIIQIFTDIFQRGEPYDLLIANMDIYPRLVELYRSRSSSKHLRTVMSDTAKLFLNVCTNWDLIKNFFKIAPRQQLKFVLRKYSEVLPYSLQERKAFLDEGGLVKVLSFQLPPGDPLNQYMEIIKSCFPLDAVNYYTPGYEESVKKKVDNYIPIYSHLESNIGSRKSEKTETEEEYDGE